MPVRKRCHPFAADMNIARKIIDDLQGRSGPVKVAETDKEIVLDAEALIDRPVEK